MPTAYVDLPPGLRTENKAKLMKEITDLIHHACLIPDTRVLLREWSADRTVKHRDQRPLTGSLFSAAVRQ
jgi:hypothetical protein